MEQLDILRRTRQNMLAAVEDLTLNQLNTIPTGFNNSIAWNLGHVVVTQQLLIYKLSGTAMHVSDDLVEKFKKGARASIVSDEDMATIKSSFMALVDQLEADIDAAAFGTFTTYPTSYGLTLNSVEDAIKFNTIHEGLHLGYVMAQRRALLK